MIENVITSVEQVTCEWLTAVLTHSRALSHGEVAGFAVDSGRGNWSTSSSLRLHYSPDAQGERPSRLFLKMVNTDLGDGEFFGPSEVDYYTRDYVDMPDAPLLRCYNGRYSSTLQRYHLLLEDVSSTHMVTCDSPPTLDYGLALAEECARLHAHWWGAARLAEASAPIHEAAYIRRFVEIAEPGARHIIEQVTDDLAPHWPAALLDLFAHHPQVMITRTQDSNGFTLIHGDAGCHNIMVPRSGERPLYLIDRQPFNWSLTTWLGVYDLAYAMVLDWEIDTRRQLEIPVLRRYHEWLVQRGVQGYTWEQLIDDYRLCVAICVYVAVEYCRGGINEQWQRFLMRMMQRVLTACDDLNCAKLWTQ